MVLIYLAIFNSDFEIVHKIWGFFSEIQLIYVIINSVLALMFQNTFQYIYKKTSCDSNTSAKLTQILNNCLLYDHNEVIKEC